MRHVAPSVDRKQKNKVKKEKNVEKKGGNHGRIVFSKY